MSAIALLALSAAAQAQERHWDANGTTPGTGGTGDWSLTAPVWSPRVDGVSGPYTSWDNSAEDDAVFEGTAGTVTLTDPITVHNLTFNTTGYVLTGDTLTLAGLAPTITTNGTTTTIDSVIAGSSGFTKAGSRTLVLNGINTFTGDIHLDAGTLNAATDAALGATGNNISTADGASVTLSIAGTTNTNRMITIGDGGTLSLNGSGAGSALITGNGRVSVGRSVTLSNDASTYTGQTIFHGVNGVATTWFTSIGNLNEASSLGAPTTVSDGTVVFNQSSQYRDEVVYLGDGDSSNRNWELNGQAANIRNQGTGTLSITGDIVTTGGSGFYADDADFELLGTLSGGTYTFTGSAGRTITLGGANSYTGKTGIASVTVRASVLADAGTASSFGAGSDTIAITSNGTLSYTGAGGSSNRQWIIGAGSILNDGSGALTLSGAVDMGTAASNSFTLGGSFAGENTLSGIVSGKGTLISDGSGTWVLSGANTREGAVIVESGALRAANASAFGTLTGVTVNGGTLDLGGFDLTAPTLQGTGGAIALGANTLTVDTTQTTSFAGDITGSGGLTKAGIGALVLSGSNTYIGDTSLNGGELALDFSAPGAPASNIVSADSSLNLAGGKLTISGADGVANSQGFDGLNITAGSNQIGATSGAGGSMTVNFGAITRTGGLVDFTLPTDGNFTTTNTSLGGWATVNGTDYAKVDGGNILAFTAADYSNKDNAADWLTGDIVSDAGGTADTPFFGTVSASVTLGGLKYTAAADSTVSMGIQALGVDGTIIVADSVGEHDQVLTGGTLTGGFGGVTLGVLQNGGGRFTIGSTIVDNSGATGFTKGGDGIVRLAGANIYTGVTTLSGGELQIASLADAGLASSIGAATADSFNLVLESGMLHYVGGTDASTNRGFTLVNGGASAPEIAVEAGRTIEFSGLVTSPDDAGLTKTGWGTLVLSNAANDYVGVTTISGGGTSDFSTISVNTLADGGVASGIGAATSDSANLVLSDGGQLQYTGGSVDIDRGFTLASGIGRIDVTEAATTLTVDGVAVGTGRLTKEGAGTLVLTGANSYTGGTVADAGTLIAGSITAFGGAVGGAGVGSLTVNAGATVDLADNSVFVGGLNGAGDVLLGSATLNINSGGTFAGTISGDGGISVTRFTQTMTGCNNSYTGVTTIGSTVSVDCLADGGQASGIGAASSDPANLVINGTLDYTGGSVTIDRGFTTSGGQIVVRDAGATLEFTGVTTGAGLIKDGAGTLVLTGASTRNGTTQIDNGTLRAGTIDAFGSGRINLANVAGATVDLAGYDTAVGYLTGGGTTGGNVTLGGATLTLNWASGSADFAGAISGNGDLIKTGGVAQTLSGCDSDYTGTTTVNSGVLAVACLTDGGVASSIGASSADASNLVINGGTLRYVGAGGSTDRQFTLGASGGNALDASGTGAIEFTSTAPLTFSGTDTAQTLTLTGSNAGDNKLAVRITNNGVGVTSLTKTGVGTWILTNPASSYTGVTRINGGVLGVDKLADGGLASSLGASSADASNLIIGNNSTLRYTGTGDTTNRLFTLAAGTTTIQSSGTGAIVFTDVGPVTLAGNNQDRTIALGGTNTGNNTLAGSIGDAGTGTTILAKNDAGTWVLTGNNTYTGYTVINDGTLRIGGGGTTGSIVSDTINLGSLVFDRSDAYAYDGVISNVGHVEQAGPGTTILTGDSTYTGGTTISAGVLQLGDGGASGSIVGDVVDNGILAFDRSDSYTFAGLISGTGSVSQLGAGTTILTANNSYTGGTTISAGTLQLGNGGTNGSIVGDVVDNGSFAIDHSDTFTFGGAISGGGDFSQIGGGTTILTADNSYTGGTTISAGVLQLGNGGTTGAIVGDVANNGSLRFFRSDDIGFDGLISGTGSVVKNGAGILTLTADNSYTGGTTLNSGTLLINGDQSAATGLIAVSSGSTLGGNGIIGGDVNVVSGGHLAPGDSPGTLTINGNLLLASGSILDYEFGEAGVAGGALNDLVNVGGDLRLDGTINVSETPGGSFDAGVYRVFNYGGTLTDNGLELGTMPVGSSVTVQTSVDGQVNLINSAGLELSFWDGNGGPKFNGAVDGGNGTWHVGGTDNNWTGSDGSINAAYADGTFAIFQGTGGAVTIDNGPGAVTASGMQFASDGYLVTGGDLALVGPQSVIRVGDNTALGAGFTATIASNLTGASQLVKTDLGTLVLTGANTYTGGTLISDGVLSVANDTFLGDAAGVVTIDGGTLQLTGATTGNWRNYNLGANGGAVDVTNAASSFGAPNALTGTGGLTKLGAGQFVLLADNSYTGGTTISEGTLQIGGNGTTGSILGDVLDNGQLSFSRSDAYTYAGSITGTGSLAVTGAGVITLTGNSNYGGTTRTGNMGGGLRIDGGAIVTSGGATNLGRSTLSIDGANAVFSTTAVSGVATGVGSMIVDVTNGGTFRVTTGDLAMRATPNVFSQINVTGANSLLDVAGGIQGMVTVNSPFSTAISAGGTLRTAGASQIGSPTSGPNALAVAITGAGSNWTSTGSLLMTAGSFTLDQGGTASFTSATFGAAPQAANLLVSGAGSSFTTTGDLTIGSGTGTGALTLTDGGQASVGGTFTLADAGTATGILNIGGAEGQAAAATGMFDAAALVFGPGEGRLNFNHTDTDYQFAAQMSGAGTINQMAGVTTLTGDSIAFAGTTSVFGGSLLVDNALGGDVGVATGGTLGGIGTIGGDVTVADGSINPGELGAAPGVLTIDGNLSLAGASTLDYNFGQANVVGGPLNDLITVGGDLVLDGTLNVQTSGGGSFDPGVYRVINYAGGITDNGLALGTAPSADFYVQTSVPGQVNLVNTAGMTLRYWDGETIASKNNGLIEGGNGLWLASGNDSWTEQTGAANAPFTDGAFAVFMGAAGTVTVDGGAGAVNASGMQFLTDGYVIEGDAIGLAGAPASVIRVGDGTAAGAAITATIEADLTGAAQLVKADLGTLILSGANSYTGGTAINGGTLQIASDGNLGDAAGGISFDGGTLFTTADIASNRAIDLVGTGTFLPQAGTTLTLSGAASGAGGLAKTGAGTLILAATNSYAGATDVNAGTLLVNGDQSAAMGLTSVASGATLGGTGTIGGEVAIADGATLAAGSNGIGTLTINGGLSLSGGSVLDFEFGEANVAGGSLNDLVNVGGDLTLDGTINVSVPSGGSFGPGIYRVFNYGGTLTDNGLALGTMPGGTVSVQTAIGGQVNLVNTAGLALSFWDGTVGPKNNNAVNGGDGVWRVGGGGNNWTDMNGAVNADYAQGSFAIFSAAPGTVTVDNGGGDVLASGMQFASDGYTITGDALTLTGTSAIIQVGDSSTAGADYIATIAADLTGAAQLVKTDAGTLILSGTNAYTGGTAINGGTLQLGDGGTSGSILGDVANNGTLAFNRSDDVAFNGIISGTGSIAQIGTGQTTLTADNSFGGETHVEAGTLLLSSGGTIDGTSLTAVRGTGILTVSGADSSLTTGGLVVGDGVGDSAILNIGSVGTVGTTDGSTIVIGGEGNGVVNVDGAGSSLITTAALQLGDSETGSGFLNVTDGGHVANAEASVGGQGAGEALVTGQDSLWANAGRLIVGDSGTGKLTIEDGAAVTNADGLVGASGRGDVIVTGLGTTWASTGQLTVGSYGIGTLLVEDGAIVTSNQGYIGAGDTADGSVIVTGSGSNWATTFNINIGNYGTGSLTIADGARVQAGDGVDLGYSAADASGSLILQGTAAAPAVLETSQIRGSLGTASVTIDGSLVRATQDNDDFVSGFGTQAIAIGANGATIDTDGHAIGIAAQFGGAGGLFKSGAGTLTLEGANSYTGATTVDAGTLLVNGDQSAATGPVGVASGATLGGIGTIGGGVTIADGGILAAGSNGVGKLTIVGDLSLGGGSQLAFELGEANVPGGPLNDLVEVGGDLTLDGTVNVTVPTGGTFGPGVYRLIDYAGALNDNGLAVAPLPGGSDAFVQTAIANQVNLVNTAGLTLNFWDGAAGPKNDGAINGGDGTWRVGGGNNNWTEASGAVNADYAQDSFAIFQAAPGIVTVDNSGGDVLTAGMQFASDGYRITGDALTLTGADALIRVGDGSAADASYTATIDADLTGGARLVKDLGGTLVLSGTNSYTGGTAINGGTLRIASDGNLGAAAGGISFDGGTLNTTADTTSSRAVDLVGAGTILTDAGTTFALDGMISGDGALAKDGAGALVLTADNIYGGGTTITAGTLQLGDGGTNGSIVGDVANAGALAVNRSDDVVLGGVISGSGAVNQIGTGTTILTADNGYTGGTTIAAGGLQLGDGGTSGSITGDVLNNGTLAFDRSDDVTFAGLISGSGGLEQAGGGATILTGTNSYTGATNVTAGLLLVNGDQSAATGLTSVASGATLGGIGTIGGDVTVADGGMLAPGAGGPGKLSINGNLTLGGGAGLAYEFGQANHPGGAFNDLVDVGGDLTLDGTIDVAVSAGGSFEIGLYRIANYSGGLTDNGLSLGAMPAGSNVFVQTAVGGQVNLVNTGSATLNFWDGAAGPKFDGAVNGGDGVWQSGLGNDNWADVSGAVNAPYADGAFAVFSAAPGTVTVDNSLGAVTASGMQFASDGYRVTGNTLTLTGVQAVVRVGDGTADGAAYTATIDAELAGGAQLVKTDLGTLVLTGSNSYTGGTAITGGTLQIVSDGNLGDAAGGLSLDGGTLHTTADITSNRAVDLAGAGTFLTDDGTTLTLGGAISGPGGLAKEGTGTLVLTGAGGNSGGIDVDAGTLLVNGDLAGASGLTSVASGAILGGTGTIGGDVALADGATLTPGAGGAGTLAIGGDLALASGSKLAFEFGEADVAGGALNDLVTVGGDLTLDGTIDVSVPAGGAFGAGVYRVFDYGGALTDNGLSLGAVPAGDVAVQTSIAGQVNLVNSAGLTLNFWDGAAGPKNDGVIEGGSGIWQNSTGNDNWTETTGKVNAAYADGAFAVFGGAGGAVTVDNSLGDVTSGGMQFAADGYSIDGDAIALAGATTTIRVGDGSTAGAGYVATIGAALTGDSQLVKTDAGTLILSGVNSYTGGTAVNGGTVQIGADANLGDAAGGVTLDGGTLATSADLASARDIVFAGAGGIATAGDTTFTFDGQFSGTGALTKLDAGTLLLTGDNGGYTAATTIAQGTLAVDGVLGGAVAVDAGARLDGSGRVGDVVNTGTIAPGRDGFGALTVGAYAGNGGVLDIETALGGDASETDRLVVTGGTSGSTAIAVTNRGGLGAQTVEGIKLVDVTGSASDGTFALRGDYLFEGDQAVIAGAYGYRLYQGGTSTPDDGDWYLRSTLLDGPNEPQGPLYQPGVPIYENYGQVLQTLTGLPTLQERVGNRSWGRAENGASNGIWGRMESSRFRPEAHVSTTASDLNVDSWQIQAGLDRTLSEGNGNLLVAGVTAHYGKANGVVRSVFGNGDIHAKGYGVGATLTWYAPDGFYADGQAQFTWFDGRLKSSVLGILVDDNDGTGQAVSLEVGKRSPVGGGLTLTPQIQMTYQNARFDAFKDPSDAAVSSQRGDSLKTRWGISIDHDQTWDANGASRRTHLYGLFNLSYEWLDGTRVDVSGTPIRNANERLWGEAALGGSLQLDDRLTIYSQVSASSAFRNFGDSYSIKGTAGVRLAF